MNICIFENEYESVRGAFEGASIVYFDDKLTFHIYTSSQDADDKLIKKCSVIFVDIDLAKSSEKDGYALIEYFRTKLNIDDSKIVILTGNNNIKSDMAARNIPHRNLQTIIKPTNYNVLGRLLSKYN